jgi:hypothetical protein
VSQNIYINQITQDFDINSYGQIVEMNSLLTEIYARLSTPIGSYRYDQNFGSVLPSYIQRRQVITLNIIKNGITNSLLPMVQRGSIVNINFELLQGGIGSFRVVLNVTDSDSNSFVFPYSVQG